MNLSRDRYRRHRLSRDSKRGAILGVCTGIAEFFDGPVWLTRVGAIVLGWFFPVHVAVAYIVAALIMPDRSRRDESDSDEDTRWQSPRRGS